MLCSFLFGNLVSIGSHAVVVLMLDKVGDFRFLRSHVYALNFQL